MKLRRWEYIAIAVVSTLLVWLFGSQPVFSQMTALRGAPPVSIGLPPVGVSRYGALEVTWVRSAISRDRLFQIASPRVINRAAEQFEQLPVEIRAQNIEDLLRLEIGRFRENALTQLMNWDFSAENAISRETQVIVSTLRNLTVVQITSADTSQPLTIATVTQTDADFYSETPERVAQKWKRALEAEIAQIVRLYSPKILIRRIEQAGLIVATVLAATLLIAFFYRRVQAAQTRLKVRYAQELEASVADRSADESDRAGTALDDSSSKSSLKSSFLRSSLKSSKSSSLRTAENAAVDENESDQPPHQLLNNQVRLEKRLDYLKFGLWSLTWLAVLIWYLGAYLFTTRLPVLMQWSNAVLFRPLNLILLWFVISLLLRASHSLIRRSVGVWNVNPYLFFGDARRRVLRSRTLSGALQGLATFALVTLGIVLTLTEFGLPVPSLLAGGAVLGLALSFGTQSLVRDLINGCLILVEDQFAVGDVITANGESGLVEKLNLRLTQLRNADGELITIPNSQIAIVRNQTSGWSRVNLGIELAYDTDVDEAIALIQKVASRMAEAEEWRSLISGEPEVLGVDAFGNDSVTIRVWIQTEPLQQWPVSREFRRRLKRAFEQAGIEVPTHRMPV